ncbi:unnamed protein product [Urochloa decumbens]|uniref:Uncharacterized protein n=1 Tax=Urochloa decumbens TaxID=240449 RepID=A0ABC8YIN5_9POAL
MKLPTVLPLVLAVSLLSHVVSCRARPSPDEPRNPSVVPHPVVILHDGEPHWHRRAAADVTGTQTQPAGVEVDGAEGRTDRADEDDGVVPSATTTASARGEDDQGGVSRSEQWSASSSRSPLLRSKLATRVMAGAPPVEGAGRKAIRADDGAAAPATASAARGEDQGGVAARSTHWTASSSRSPQLLRFKLARRVLVEAPPGEGAAADSAARPSCGSSNVHNGCPPRH